MAVKVRTYITTLGKSSSSPGHGDKTSAFQPEPQAIMQGEGCFRV